MGAVLSKNKKFRYLLSRDWSEFGYSMYFVMLNPSTADAEQDDPTIRRCIQFAKREGYAGIVVANLFAFRATDPSYLHPGAVGKDNEEYLRALLKNAYSKTAPVVCAWGANPKAESQANLFMALARIYKVRCVCLGVTKSGAPRHPLYVRSDQPLIPYQPMT